MRVIAGSLGGRTFDSPGTFKTHPMSDKARGALFNILGDIEELTFLDAFAGTGALSFEAVSRGAASCLAIEQDKAAQKVITANIKALGLGGRVRLVQASAGAWLSTSTDTFDIVACDPPYNDLQISLVKRLAMRVTSGGLLVLSWPENAEIPEIDGLRLLDRRTYGDATLVFYRRIQ